ASRWLNEAGFLPTNVLGGHVVLGITSRPVEYLRGVPDLVSWREGRHTRPDRSDNAGYVVSGNGRQLHRVAIITTSDLVIQRIDGGCMDPDEDLTGFRLRLGQVTKFERLRATK